MLGFEWTDNSSSSPYQHSQLMLSDIVDNLNHHNHNHNRNHGCDQNHNHDNITSQTMGYNNNQIRPTFEEQFNCPYTFQHHNATPPHPSNNPFYQNHLFYDPRAFQGASYPNTTPSLFTLDALSGSTRFSPFIPKFEPDPIPRPIGLDLGGRTYFSPDDDLVSRLWRRSRSVDVAVNAPKCQAEGCNADLSNAKHYHRRHKVCEFHSKASTVVSAGLIQRFCQQCSRFHLLVEFDDGKRSCRKRLAVHNRRRRKSQQIVTQDNTVAVASPVSSENARTSPSQRSPTSNLGINSSSITIAMSPPQQASFGSSFRPILYP